MRYQFDSLEDLQRELAYHVNWYNNIRIHMEHWSI
ncbi:IS3 family transposase [Bacillus sp. JJ722]